MQNSPYKTFRIVKHPSGFSHGSLNGQLYPIWPTPTATALINLKFLQNYSYILCHITICTCIMACVLCILSDHINIITVHPSINPIHFQYLVAVVSPATELHVAMLVIEGKPGDVYLACALENAGWYVQTTAVVSDHHVRLVRPIKTLVSTIRMKNQQPLTLPHVNQIQEISQSQWDWTPVLHLLFFIL